jgi:hypothetical protein
MTLFGNYLSRLFRLKLKNDNADLKKLKDEIINSSPNKRQWLLKKTEEF